MNEISDKAINDALQDINSQDTPKKDYMIGGITLDEAHRRAVIACKKKAADRKQRAKEIVQEAINSTFIDLNAPLSVAHKRLLIKLLTKTYTDNMIRNEAYINRRITKMLELIIPHDLLNSYRAHKESVIPAVGFTYKASEEYGKGLQFKVSLDLPYYFHPDDIQGILTEHWPERLISVDKAVAFFHRDKETRTKKEVSIANRLTRASTFYHLVKINPFWYDTLVQELKAQADRNGEV